MHDASQRRVEACSVCRGDYEDSDASVMRDDSSVSEDDEENDDESNEEFPVRRERR